MREDRKILICNSPDGRWRTSIYSMPIKSGNSFKSLRTKRIIYCAALKFNDVSPQEKITDVRDNSIIDHRINERRWRKVIELYQNESSKPHQSHPNTQHGCGVLIHGFLGGFVFLKKESGFELGFSQSEDKEYQIHSQNTDAETYKGDFAILCQDVNKRGNAHRYQPRRHIQHIEYTIVLKKSYVRVDYFPNHYIIPVFFYYFTISQTNKKGEIHV